MRIPSRQLCTLEVNFPTKKLPDMLKLRGSAHILTPCRSIHDSKILQKSVTKFKLPGKWLTIFLHLAVQLYGGNQSTKTHLHRAVCHERIKGA